MPSKVRSIPDVGRDAVPAKESRASSANGVAGTPYAADCRCSPA
jgi:hypothetical protein